LYILKDSPIYKLYKNKNFKILTKDEYVELILRALDEIDEKTVVHRISGDPPKLKLYEPKWCADKLSVISQIDKALKENNRKIISQDDIIKIVNYWKEKDRAFAQPS
ncbi:MAG: TIGR01212 family radical SAM protein, partial [Peptoniphilus sp.]